MAPDFIRAVGDVLAFGAKKYEAWSWSKGKEWSRDYGAAMRHLIDWANGEDNDPESGLPHLAHAACDIMFLIVSQHRGLGTDDRKKFARKTALPVYLKDARVDRVERFDYNSVVYDVHLSAWFRGQCAWCGWRDRVGLNYICFSCSSSLDKLLGVLGKDKFFNCVESFRSQYSRPTSLIAGDAEPQ